MKEATAVTLVLTKPISSLYIVEWFYFILQIVAGANVFDVSPEL